MKSIGRKAVNGAALTTVVYGVSQALRLGSNLVLTRLLAPEHFGLMAIVNVFLIGLAMFSDIGVGPNIIQNDRGEDKAFLNAAWTLQFLRGLVLGLICVIAAWPMAQFYNSAELTWLIPACGLGVVISGLNSTNIYTAYRNLEYKKLALLEISTQGLTICAMIFYAWLSPTVWALVFGAVFSALAKAIASHVMLEGPQNKFHWDAKISREIARFGQWIFFSTVLSFASNSAGSLILAKFVDMHQVGLFSIAVTLSKAVEQLYDQIANKVLLPLYAQYKNLPVPELRLKTRRIKLVLMAVFLPMLWVMIVFGPKIIGLLLDKRYSEAAWIFQVFSLSIIPTIISGIGPFYLALGNSKLTTKLAGIRLLVYLGSMGIGWYLAGSVGIIVGMAMYTYLYYFADLFVQWSYGVWQPRLDFIASIISGMVVGGGWIIFG